MEVEIDPETGTFRYINPTEETFGFEAPTSAGSNPEFDSAL